MWYENKIWQGRWQYSRKSSKIWFVMYRRETYVTADPPCHRYHPSTACPSPWEFLLLQCLEHWPHWGWAHLQCESCSGVYQLKASQFRSAWTSQAALRRKSKLTAPPPLTKTHSSWRATVCSRSPCHHPLTLRAPYTHLDTLTVALEAPAPTGAPAMPPEEWHTRHTADLLREGGLLAAECLQALWRWSELLLPCTQLLLISWALASSYRPDQAASNKEKN